MTAALGATLVVAVPCPLANDVPDQARAEVAPSVLRPGPATAAAPPAAAVEAPTTVTASETLARSRPDVVAWREGWTRFSVGDYVATGIGAGLMATGLLMGPNESAPWRGGILADDATRRAMRLSTESARATARSVSDITLGVLVTYPFVVDSLLVAGVHHGSADVAGQMALINAEVLAVTVGVQTLTKAVASRERPYGQECGSALAAGSPECSGSDRYQSFFSGHTAMAFASAAVTCSHHMNLPLYGQDSAVGPCVGGFALATATGALRILGDRHYLSDVLIGAAVGTAIGFGIPLLFHYNGDDDDEDDAKDGLDDAPAVPAEAVQVRLVPSGAGAAIVGTF